MTNKGIPAKTFRFVGIFLMALTSGLTLLAGIGTTCVAISPTNFGDSMAKLASFQWLYIFFMLAGIAIGSLGIRVTIQLTRGAKKSYRNALILLAAGVIIGAIHIFASRALRGNSMPVDAVVYVTFLTLAIFLIFRIPTIWRSLDFSKGDSSSNKPVSGVAAIALGILTLTIQYLMSDTHTWNAVNYADAFHISMTIIGMACLLFGVKIFLTGLLITKPFRQNPKQMFLTINNTNPDIPQN